MFDFYFKFLSLDQDIVKGVPAQGKPSDLYVTLANTCRRTKTERTSNADSRRGRETLPGSSRSVCFYEHRQTDSRFCFSRQERRSVLVPRRNPKRKSSGIDRISSVSCSSRPVPLRHGKGILGPPPSFSVNCFLRTVVQYSRREKDHEGLGLSEGQRFKEVLQ